MKLCNQTTKCERQSFVATAQPIWLAGGRSRQISLYY